MRAVLQRVSEASVFIEGQCVGHIERGILLLLGIAQEDGPEECDFLAEKTVNLRIFGDREGKMNRSVLETGGGILVVSQFTLYGDCKKGRRPSFFGAARPETAIPLYERFLAKLQERGIPIASGRFGADMQVMLTNDGPVTIFLDTDSIMPARMQES